MSVSSVHSSQDGLIKWWFPECPMPQKEESITDEESDNDTGEMSADTVSSTMYRPRRNSSLISIPKQNHYGSFYLRMGAVGTIAFSFAFSNSFVFCSSLRDRKHDLFRPRVRTVLRTRKEHQMPQRPLSLDASDANGVYFYTDVFHIPQ